MTISLTDPFTRRVAATHLMLAVSLAALASPPEHTQAEQDSQKADLMPIQAMETKVVHGFLIGVSGSPLGGNASTNDTSTDDPLIYTIWTAGNPAWIALPAEPEYAYKLQLLDMNGLAVPKTKLGEQFGTKFSDFGPNSKVRHYHANTQGKSVALNYLFAPFNAQFPFKPIRPSDIFEITKPGNYTLRIAFQIMAFPRTGPKRTDYTNDLIRFAPLDYPLVQHPK